MTFLYYEVNVIFYKLQLLILLLYSNIKNHEQGMYLRLIKLPHNERPDKPITIISIFLVILFLFSKGKTILLTVNTVLYILNFIYIELCLLCSHFLKIYLF